MNYKLLIALCLSKENLMKIMDDYPDARKFYFDMAFNRRIEFRRIMKKFYDQLEESSILEKLLYTQPVTKENIYDDDDEIRAEESYWISD